MAGEIESGAGDRRMAVAFPATAAKHAARHAGHAHEPGLHVPGKRPRTLESYGTTADGRAFYVVSTVNRKFVITVVELEEL
ncbi:MAG TPA: hypothetical protein VN224_16965 [Xanthomonadales bacterium]|nr:hypothetical protein [Xanthomonadales bacterium]